MVGERISWKGVNRIESGIVEQEARITVGNREIWSYEVRLDNGKYVIVSEDSVTEQ